MTAVPATFTDENGQVRLEGTITGSFGTPVTLATTDPGAIGAGQLWLRLDPDETLAPMLYVRNAANDGWADMSGAGRLLGLTYYDGATAAVSVSGDATHVYIDTPNTASQFSDDTRIEGESSVSLAAGLDEFHAETAGSWVKRNNVKLIEIYDATVYLNDDSANHIVSVNANGVGFNGATPSQPSGVAVSTAAIHAALVTLGLITA